MKIASMFQPDKVVFSLEIFPPKKTSGIETIYSTLDELSGISPDSISVTYGAGGNVADSSTVDLAGLIKNEHNIESVAHLTCVNSTKEDVKIILSQLREQNVENILALRGDRRPDVEPKKEFLYAADLISFIREHGDFGIAAACYPEVHSEAKNAAEDILYLRDKVDAGVDYLITQLFLDNAPFYSFMERAAIAGIKVPVEVGIMPITSKTQIEKTVSMCGASVPPKFAKMVQRYGDNPEAMRDAGIAYAVDQIVDLIANGVDGIHLYTMNNAYVAKRIYESIANLLKK